MHLPTQPFIKSIYQSPIYPQYIHFHSDPSVYSFTFPPINPSILPSHYPPDSKPSTHSHFHPPVLQIQPLTYIPVLPVIHRTVHPPVHPPPFIALSFYFCHPPEADCSYFNVFTCPVKGQAIPLQAWTGPEGSRRLRLPNFKTAPTLMYSLVQ